MNTFFRAVNVTSFKLFVITICGATLAGCGGGGGGGGTSLSYQSVVTSVAAFTYAGDDQTIANALQDIRQGMGIGLLARNSTLDQAASGHASYLVDNNLVSDGTYLASLHSGILGAHYEDNSNTGFTGASPATRATAAGYSGTVTEVTSFGAASGADCLSSQENSVYHLISLISPYLDVGIAFDSGSGSGSACVIELGTPSITLGQLPASGIAAYPYDTQTDVLPTYYNQAEVPNPASDLTTAGHPIVVSLYSLAATTLTASNVVVQSFTLSDGSNPVSSRVLVKSGVTSTGPQLTVDANISDAGFVVLLPVAPLAPNTTYQVSYTGTAKGSSVSKNWSFTTGNAN